MGSKRKDVLNILAEVVGEEHPPLVPLDVVLHHEGETKRVPTAMPGGGRLSKVGWQVARQGKDIKGDRLLR